MELEILSPDKNIFTGEVDLVQLPGTDGSFEILNNHAPMISSLGEGKIKFEKDKSETFVDISGGFVEVLNNKVIVLVEGVKEGDA